VRDTFHCWGPPTPEARLHQSQVSPSFARHRLYRLPAGPQGKADRFGVGRRPFRRSNKMARLEAALLVTEHALSARKLMQHAKLADLAEVRTLIEQLNLAYDRSRTAFRIEQVATGFQMLTRPKFAPWLDRLHHRQARLKLSAPMMETLSIVAYRQPITRADVEAVRGVQTSEMLKQLMERGLIRIVGEDDSLGRPYLYGTTRLFLESFGLQSLNDMPLAEKLRLRPPVESESADDADADADEVVASEEAADDDNATDDEALAFGEAA
jgi:segregation and condensation protein B